MRIAATAVMVALLSAPPVAADEAVGLVELFSRTCALTPALPSALNQRAILAGFSPAQPPIKPEQESEPILDLVYSARFARADMRVSLSAYFSGDAREATVSCGLSSEGVTPKGLRSALESSMPLGEPIRFSDQADRTLGEWRTPNFELSISVHTSPPYRGTVHAQYRRPRT